MFNFSAIFVTGNLLESDSKGEKKSSKWANNEEIELFREYLRIPTVHPDVNYSKSESYFGH